MVIHIDTTDIDLDEDEITNLVHVLNGIVYACHVQKLFSEGGRNEIILNMTVASWLLGLAPADVLDDFVNNGVIDPNDDDENTYGRMRRMLNYTDRFCWDYMVDPHYYRCCGESYMVDPASTLPVYFSV